MTFRETSSANFSYTYLLRSLFAFYAMQNFQRNTLVWQCDSRVSTTLHNHRRTFDACPRWKRKNRLVSSSFTSQPGSSSNVPSLFSPHLRPPLSLTHSLTHSLTLTRALLPPSFAARCLSLSLFYSPFLFPFSLPSSLSLSAFRLPGHPFPLFDLRP